MAHGRTQAISRLSDDYPLPRFHLYDEADHLRKHVLLYFNDENIAWLNRRDAPLKAGDRLAVLQNISGG